MKTPEANILLNYLEKAMDMEASVYGQKLLALAYSKAVSESTFKEPQMPQKNVRTDLNEPEKPGGSFDIVMLLFWIALAALSALCAIAMLISADFMMTIGSLLFCSLFLLCARKRLKKNIQRKKEYIEEVELIQNILILDEELYLKKLEKYNEDYKLYLERKRNFDNKCSIMKEKLQDTLKASLDTLEKLYEVDIVKPEYRNLAAICSLYGYIEQRRAAYLDGMYGAYDIYNEEMRQTIITDNIPDDEDGMRKIKQNQFDLYQILRNKKGQVERLVMNVSGEANYYAFIDECCDLNEDIMSLIEMKAWDEPDYSEFMYETEDTEDSQNICSPECSDIIIDSEEDSDYIE